MWQVDAGATVFVRGRLSECRVHSASAHSVHFTVETCGLRNAVRVWYRGGLSDSIRAQQERENACAVHHRRSFVAAGTKDPNVHPIRILISCLYPQLATEAKLMQYDVLVLDEVHERHLHGDFLLGITKCLLRIRPELKVILMSATINIKLFADYFADEKVRVIEVPGRLFPIKLHYMPQLNDPTAAQGRQSKAERLSPEPYIQIMQLIDNKYPSNESCETFHKTAAISTLCIFVRHGEGRFADFHEWSQ